jgi:glyoxylase-like metal-dependent hydrolase (beta-lactamase superfamily II)
MENGVYPLSEGTYTIAGDHIFVPFNIETDHMRDRPASLLVEIQPFLLVTDTDKIIIDPGLGLSLADGRLHIYHLLERFGLQASDITKVLLSHLHLDHTGGVVHQVLENGKWTWIPTFPNAVYYWQQAEWEYAQMKGTPSYPIERLEAMRFNAKHIVLNGDTCIDGYIDAVICGGHTPNHQYFIIRDKKETYFYGGDVVPQFSQMQRKFVAKYDYDGKRSAELRSELTVRAIDEDWVCLFFHDIRKPYCKVKMLDGMVMSKD